MDAPWDGYQVRLLPRTSAFVLAYLGAQMGPATICVSSPLRGSRNAGEDTHAILDLS